MTDGSETRYSWGADEHLVVQIAEAMSLEANFSAMAMSRALTRPCARGRDGHLSSQRLVAHQVRP